MISASRRSPGSPAFEHVFECGIAASCILTSCSNRVLGVRTRVVMSKKGDLVVEW